MRLIRLFSKTAPVKPHQWVQDLPPGLEAVGRLNERLIDHAMFKRSGIERMQE